jgi:hypothetical protein
MPCRWHGGEYGKFYSFLTLTLDGGGLSASRYGRALTPGKIPQYPLDRRLDGPHSWSGHTRTDVKSVSLPEIEPRSPGLQSDTMLTELFHLHLTIVRSVDFLSAV